MPTYEYICTGCRHEWEAEQSIKDDALKTCPKCKAKKAQRQISRGAGFILKGGGWYSDLYSSSGGDSSPADKGSTSESKPSSDSSTSKSDAKPSTPAKTEGASASPKAETKSKSKSESK